MLNEVSPSWTSCRKPCNLRFGEKMRHKNINKRTNADKQTWFALLTFVAELKQTSAPAASGPSQNRQRNAGISGISNMARQRRLLPVWKTHCSHTFSTSLGRLLRWAVFREDRKKVWLIGGWVVRWLGSFSSPSGRSQHVAMAPG